MIPEMMMSKKDKKQQVKKAKVILPLGVKISFFVALMLASIMALISMFVVNWVGAALEKEVGDRGIAIAKNIANNAENPLLTNDDLSLTYLTKQAIQDPPTAYVGGRTVYETALMIIKRISEGSPEIKMIKNEGIIEAYIVKNDGTIASAHDVKYNGSYYELPPGTRKITENDDVVIQDYIKDGKSFFDIGVPVITSLNKRKYMSGEVHLTVTKSLITDKVTEAVVTIGMILIASLIAGILLSILIVNVMVKPIGYLVKGVRAIGEGNYDVEIKLKTGDELGVLTEVFNETAKSLKEKETLKGAFSRYVSKEVMEEVLNDPSKLNLHGKRVRATMLFTDIRGFTSMSETQEPEDVVKVINEYLTVQTDKVFKHKGVLDKFVGDCVMAVFGVPVPKVDDSYRAVLTAMDIRDSVNKLNEIRKRTNQIVVGIGIGVNTGDVVAGNMGSPQKMDYTVIGDNVNLAARLEANAPAGRVFVSESTYIETKDRIEYVQAESIMVKGKKDPVKIFEPVKIISEAVK